MTETEAFIEASLPKRRDRSATAPLAPPDARDAAYDLIAEAQWFFELAPGFGV